MNKKISSFHAFFFITAAFIWAPKPFAEPVNLEHFKQELYTYHDSGAYQQEFQHVVAAARRHLMHAIRDNAQSTHPKKLAIVLDIDETSLSHYDAMAQHHFSLSKTLGDKINARGDAPSFPSMLSLYQAAKRYHVAIFFVSGRPITQEKITADNLHRAGYIEWSGMYLRPLTDHASSVVPFKSRARKEIARQGYTIIACIGDQTSDLQGGNTGKSFKLPNPYYMIL